MKCPKCNSQKTQPVTDDNLRFYCVDCNYIWKKENGANESSGTLSFEGIPKAKQIYEALTKGQEFTPEFRAAMEAQITGLLLDQWFEGMKAGSMASILYAKEYYGKNRDDSEGATSPSKEREGRTRETRENRRSRRVEDTADPRASMRNITARERINTIELTYPRGILVPENVREAVAIQTDINPHILSAHFDGHKLTADIKHS